MTTLKLIAFLGGAVFFCLFFDACDTRTCMGVSCPRNQICQDGYCDCQEGYMIVSPIHGCVRSDCSALGCGPLEVCNMDPASGVYCACKDGYERDSSYQCVEERVKFVGVYNTSHDCASGSYRYASTLTANIGGAIDELEVQNLYNMGQTILASVEGDSITIASQTLGSGTISGAGNLSGNRLTLDYSHTDQNGSVDNCSAILVK